MVFLLDLRKRERKRRCQLERGIPEPGRPLPGEDMPRKPIDKSHCAHTDLQGTVSALLTVPYVCYACLF